MNKNRTISGKHGSFVVNEQSGMVTSPLPEAYRGIYAVDTRSANTQQLAGLAYWLKADGQHPQYLDTNHPKHIEHK